MIIDLTGNWQFGQKDKKERYNAIVPGCNYLDLMNNGLIQDPFVKDNEAECGWVAQTDWTYCREFEIDKAQLQYSKIDLCFKQLDTITQIYLNDDLIGKTDNCHIEFRFDVKDKLKEGKNSIRVDFLSPVRYVLEKQEKEKCPNNSNGLTGIPHIRKPQCHFGWDWGPVLTPSGISGDVFVECRDDVQIRDLIVRQSHGQQVELNVVVDVDNVDKKDVIVVVKITTPDGQTLESRCQADKSEHKFVIEQPMLWQPNGYCEDRRQQPLYKVDVEVSADGKVVDAQSKSIGLRTILLDTSNDQYGSNFRFVVNGVPTFCKGANWIPADSFINRITKETLQQYVEIAAESGFNMIRVWGGGYYETDEFYDLCDKYGIMVWQDFAYACQPYPFFDDEFLDNTLREVEYNVKRLRHHASLALWCGNNEIEVMSTAWLYKVKYVEWTEKYFYHILPEQLRKFDQVTPYIAGTPIGSAHNKDVGSDSVGDTHLWAVWHGLQDLTYYRTRNTRFCSEFGFESLPDIKTIRKFADPSDYSLDSKVFTAHQKCASGNKKMQFYIASNYRLPAKFEDYIYLSQLCQAECVKDATEHWRRNTGRCNGSLYWQFNDCWPVCSWAGLDYYRNYKALQYECKKFFAPVIVSLENDKKGVGVYVINDTDRAVDVKVRIMLTTFDGNVVFEQELTATVDSIDKVMLRRYDIKQLKKTANLKRCVFVAYLYRNGRQECIKTVLFGREKNLKLPQSDVDMQIEVADGVAKISLASKRYVRKLALTSNSVQAPFSDNFFDLLPGETKEVYLPVKDMSVQQVRDDITMCDVSRIKPKAGRLSDWWTRCKIFMIPVNFFSYIYYKYII
ncbi:MAG: glycosyl hydrolase 2 galactose-binding domain-containing protein [Christensenellales bacterium]